MMNSHACDVSDVAMPDIAPFHIVDERWGMAPDGTVIGCTNRYLTMNGAPWYVIGGECQYSRLDPSRWDTQLAKMAACGINVVSTYAFWNHHETREGVWDFTGRRDMRRFVELCGDHGLKVIVRIGPFVHGECRNGGLPDWLYGRPYEVRSLDSGFLACVREWYGRVAGELKGLFFKDGGPIIAAQLDNEYMHSSAPWEMTTGVSDEWVPIGHDGVAYIRALRKIAEDVGIAVPFFTSTAWGGAPVPDDVLPLWGGYPYRPWLFYAGPGEHPVTDEYLYRDFHDDACPRNEEFDPAYPPNEKPYACCEMGGGMFSSYRYRFVLPMKSVDAMANIKMASGCNVIGYYLFQGGANPIGDGIYLNESQTPKVSYDFQAALGSCGQTRESYRRLKSLHSFARAFGDRLCSLPTVIPDDQRVITPENTGDLRWCVRTDGRCGFVFIDNFQDHAAMRPQHGQTIILALRGGERVVLDGVGLAAGENCVLPFNMDLDGVRLLAATAQPVTVIRIGCTGVRTFVFLRPDGMDRCWFRFANGVTHEVLKGREFDEFEVRDGDRLVNIVCVSRALADSMTVVDDGMLVFAGKQVVRDVDTPSIVNDAATVYGMDGHIVIECPGTTSVSVRTYPKCRGGEVNVPESVAPAIAIEKISDDRYVIALPDGFMDGDDISDMRLRIRYSGDIGWLWCGGTLIDDNFCNGDIWEVGLHEHARILSEHGNRLTLTITPLKDGVVIDADSAMAARAERVDRLVCGLDSVELVPVRTVVLRG